MRKYEELLYHYMVLCRLEMFLLEAQEQLQYFEIKNDIAKDTRTRNELLAEEIFSQIVEYAKDRRTEIIQILKERDFINYETIYNKVFTPNITYNRTISKHGHSIIVPDFIDNIPIDFQEKFSDNFNVFDAVIGFIKSFYELPENQLPKAKMILRQKARAKERDKDWIEELQEAYNIRMVEEGDIFKVEDDHDYNMATNVEIIDMHQFMEENGLSIDDLPFDDSEE